MPSVICGEQVSQSNSTGLRVDFHDCNVGAARERSTRLDEVSFRIE